METQCFIASGTLRGGIGFSKETVGGMSVAGKSGILNPIYTWSKTSGIEINEILSTVCLS